MAQQNVGTTEQISSFERIAQGIQEYLLKVTEVEWLSTFITAFIVLVVTSFASHFATKFLRRLLSHDDSPLPSSSVLVNIARVVVWSIGISVVLSTCCGIDVTAAVAALGIGGIAISLGFQDTLANLISGLQLSINRIIEPGDHIEAGGYRGIVRDITWRHTVIETLIGQTIVIPNSVINTSSFLKLPPQRKIIVPISVVTQGEDMEEMAKRIEEAARVALEPVGTIESAPEVSFNAITEFGYGGTVVAWMEEGVDVLAAQTAIVKAVAPVTRHEVAQDKAPAEA